MKKRRRQAECHGDAAHISSGLVLIRAGAVIPIQLPYPDKFGEPKKVRETEMSGQTAQPAARVKEDSRASVGQTLRWAFPLPDSGSFDQLLAALEES